MPDFLEKSRWTSTPAAAVVIAAHLSAKALACRWTGDDIAVADALVLLPLALITYRSGMLFGAAFAVMVPIVNTVIICLAADMLMQQVYSGLLRNLAVCQAVVLIVGTATGREKSARLMGTAKADEYRRKLYMLDKQKSMELEGAHTSSQKRQREVDHYSSLLLLLHEAAEKLSAHLEINELVDTLFTVLDQSFRASRATIYIADPDGDSFRLVKYYRNPQHENPLGSLEPPPRVISSTDTFLLHLAKLSGAVYVPREDLLEAARRYAPSGVPHIDPRHDSMAADMDACNASPIDSLLSCALHDKDQIVGLVNIHAMKINGDFDVRRDVELLSMISNIASIALSNAKLFSQIQYMAERDSLTGVYNRRYFFEHLANAMRAVRGGNATAFGLPSDDAARKEPQMNADKRGLERTNICANLCLSAVSEERQRQINAAVGQRKDSLPIDQQPGKMAHPMSGGQAPHQLAVIMCDLDHFKQVNDTYGHQAGDEVLRQFVSRCTRQIGEDDLLARYGGEEFIVLLRGADITQASSTAERIRRAVAEQPFKCEPAQAGRHETIPVTISLGVAAAPMHGRTVTELLRQADDALYSAKESGRNRVVRADDAALAAVEASYH